MIGILTAKVKRLEEGCNGGSLEEKIERMVDRKLAEKLDDRVERDERKNNLIVVNLPESTKSTVEEKKQDDIERLKDMIKEKNPDLVNEEILEPTRLGKVGEKPRLLRVKVKSQDIKMEFVKLRLNDEVTPLEERVYINPDYTPAEREKNKQLRKELKDRIAGGERNIGIRNGKIVEVKWRARPGQADQEDH